MAPIQNKSAIVERHKLVAESVKVALEESKPLLVISLPGTGKDALIKEVANENGVELKMVELAGETQPSKYINFNEVKSAEKYLKSKFAEGDRILLDAGLINNNSIMPLLTVLEAMKNLNIHPIVECNGKVLLEANIYPNMDSLLEDVSNRAGKNYKFLSSAYQSQKQSENLANITPEQYVIMNDGVSKEGLLDKIKNLKFGGLPNSENNLPGYKK